MRSNPTLKRLYLTLNRRWFGNKLPLNLIIQWDKSLHRMGLAGRYVEYEGDDIPRILLNPYFKGWDNLTEFTLLHEMAHAAIPNDAQSSDHGPRFQAEMMRLARAGAFSKCW